MKSVLSCWAVGGIGCLTLLGCSQESPGRAHRGGFAAGYPGNFRDFRAW